jgi:NAD(P)-dependent dehydrogenase (short-subunit alcohol dehydrogenase family)
MKYEEGMLREGALENKVILITGGGTGLGRSMGQYFFKTGSKTGNNQPQAGCTGKHR